ncbi:hypothetical protein [Methanosphaerula subterraneus]|uniref:hypothetical protein n=1 Tax=Methanosphaerula subterraneus TaxID=3350244 RepID=UPI003F86DC82
MVDGEEKRGLLVLGGLALLILIGAVLAFQITGPMGIEDRFTEALGLQHDGGAEEEDGGFFGFSLEGNILAYLAVLALLIAVSLFALKRTGI